MLCVRWLLIELERKQKVAELNKLNFGVQFVTKIELQQRRREGEKERKRDRKREIVESK